MPKLLWIPVLILLLVACNRSDDGGTALPTLMPTPDIDESPRTEATPDPGLPPTWTPAPEERTGHLFDTNEAASGTIEVAGTRFVHTVQRGETLGIIAARYGVSVNDLVSLNNIRNPDLIEVGQQIIIPVP